MPKKDETKSAEFNFLQNAMRGKSPFVLAPEALDRLLKEAGVVRETVAKAITAKDGQHASVDTRHMDWLINMPDFVPAARKDPPQNRWAELHTRSRSLVTDVKAETAFIYTLADNINGTCKCRDHWMAYLKANRPTADILSDPAAYFRWGIDAHNAVNARIKKKVWTYEEADLVVPYSVFAASAGAGMGDAVVAMYAASGLAKAINRPVNLHTRHGTWLARASFPGVTVRPQIERGIDFSGGWHGPYGYYNSAKLAPSRVWAYCVNIAAGYALPPFGPVRPNINRTPGPTVLPPGPYALFAPFTSNWPVREWQIEKWQELAKRLVADGLRIVVIDSSREDAKFGKLLSGMPPVSLYYGRPSTEVQDLILGAAVVVGNDSGIVHMGGLLGVPTVAVHAGSYQHKFLFDAAPSVTSVTADPRPPRATDFKALASVTVDRVYAAVKAAITPAATVQ